MRNVGLALMCLTLAGCAIPFPLTVASFVMGTGSMLSTGKSVPDHFLSFTMEQDCAMWHVVKGERLCQELPAEEVIAIREQKRRRHRGLIPFAQRDEPESPEGVALAWRSERLDEQPIGGTDQMASTGRWLGDQPPAIAGGGAPTLQLAARSGADAGVPMYQLPPAVTPPSPVIIAEAVEARTVEPAQTTAARRSNNGGLPQIPVVPKKSSNPPAGTLGTAAPAGATGIAGISSMIAQTASVDAAAIEGLEIDLPPDQRKLDLSGNANLLTTDDAEVARRLAEIKRMTTGQPAAAAPTVVASLLPRPVAAVPEAAAAAPPVPAQTVASPAVDKALKRIIDQAAPEAGVAAVPAPVSRAGASGVDKVKSLFEPKRQTVFGTTLVGKDGLPAVPPLAARTEAGDDGDPVMLPAGLAMIAPALGGAAVAPSVPHPSDPSSAYAEPAWTVATADPAMAEAPIRSLPPAMALAAPSWQPIADERLEPAAVAVEAPVPTGRYLILGSFLKQANAVRLAALQEGVDAAVRSAKVKGRTWYRVVVPDRRGIRRRVAAAGITDYWVVKM